jgi:hypothetical protein
METSAISSKLKQRKDRSSSTSYKLPVLATQARAAEGLVRVTISTFKNIKFPFNSKKKENTLTMTQKYLLRKFLKIFTPLSLIRFVCTHSGYLFI